MIVNQNLVKKVCSKCNKLLSLEFFSSGNSSFKKVSWCKDCYKKYRQNHPENRTKEKSLYYKIKLELNPWINSYKNAKQRCTNPRNKDYKNYGGRGIIFDLTYDDMEYLWNRDKAWLMKKPSIDRIDNNGNYELSNCRFIEFNLNIKRAMPIAIRDKQGKFINKYK